MAKIIKKKLKKRNKEKEDGLNHVTVQEVRRTMTK